MENIGTRLKKLRVSKRWSQAFLANILKLSTPAYSKIETNITIPNITRVKQLAVVFNVSMKMLIEGDAETQDLDAKIALTDKLIESDKYLKSLQEKFIELYEELYQLEMVTP